MGGISSPPARTAHYEPSVDLPDLFREVELSGIFPDSKSFADASPRIPVRQVAARFADLRSAGPLTPARLRGFVRNFFEVPPPAASAALLAAPAGSMEAHIQTLWGALTRSPDRASGISTLIPLGRQYIVPGGRFREVYYWDSYFTALGLVQGGRLGLVSEVLENFQHLIMSFGHVPNGNRTYYLTRSQPPVYGEMLRLAERAGAPVGRHLAALEVEYGYWMEGADALPPVTAHRRVVRFQDGDVLNRHWDDRPEPRTESFREDVSLADTLPEASRAAFFTNVRAAAESGWDFSSRWMTDPRDLRSLETTGIVPVDLNAWLYQAELVIAHLREARGDVEGALRFEAAARRRRDAILRHCWDPAQQFFFDVRWATGHRLTDRPSLAAVVPLYFGIATPEQGRAVAARLGREFLKPGGFVTTLVHTGQQWDAPNGWAPLEWMAIQGVGCYGSQELADAARARWLRLVRRTYRSMGKLMEKYDVEDLSRPAGGGEYPSQDGFGWTNGVAQALAAQPAGSARCDQIFGRE
jgi:alpha,alpha-trehalase